MNSITHIETIYKIKQNIYTSLYYDHSVSMKNSFTMKTISIVMTSSNRSKQTYYTLNSIKNSSYKDVHVVLVDDSTSDPIDFNILKEYPFSIDFINIKRENKNWSNPCVNYNIGFLFIKGGKVIIQNAEVFHVGDVLTYVDENVNDTSYHVFDVKSSNSYESNEKIYLHESCNIDVYNDPSIFNVGAKEWYQCSKTNNRRFHFLTAMSLYTFNLFREFSYDYCFEGAYDDDDLVLKIISKNIPIISVDHTISKCGGVHLYHVLAEKSWEKSSSTNCLIFSKKQKYYNTNNVYIEMSDSVFLYNKLMNS